jgi:DNA-directed RNA polymerase specialized sigma24 family protein
LLRARRRLERMATLNFDEIEQLIDAGQGRSPAPLQEREVSELAEEVRLGCTQAMLGALDPAQRITYILSDIFDLDSRDGAAILGISPANFANVSSEHGRTSPASWSENAAS